MSDVLALTNDLIARPSVTPDDAGCQAMISERLARAGFRCEQIEAVAHFKLMVDAKVVDIVQRELAAAALVEARWG